ncbi:MAG: AMP-binding protein [Acidobacteria bacterium]|nr:AMP-binding protein [Acidobacteriota bacterium]
MTTLTSSHVSGATDVPLIDETIPAAFARTVDRWGARNALVARHQGVRWTWAELAAEVDALAAGLLALGLEPGDRIGIWAPNCAEWTVTQLATARIGLILVNINPAYRLHELEYSLNKVECKALVTAHTFKSSDYVAMVRTVAPEIDHCGPGALRSAKLPHLNTVIRLGSDTTAGMYTFRDVRDLGGTDARSRLDAITGRLQPDDAINIQFTSGTTGFPKGATLTHKSILNNGYFTGQAQRLTEQDRVCIPVPLYHCFGMVLGNLACISVGAAMIYPSDAFNPRAVLETVAAERCTSLYGVPTMFIAELGHPDFDTFDLGSLRTGIMAGAPCPIAVMKNVVDKMHMREVTIAYGMTETSPVSFQSSPTDPIERRVSTVGRVLAHVEVKIVDQDGGTVPPGTSGELCTRGYSVMKGYWNDADKTAEAIDADGWMHTGDLATLDAEGYCNIVGRVKDMVIRGGENVYPREVEEFLHTHPKIADVQVFGVPDEKYGEEICAWIVLRHGATADTNEIRAFCQGQIAHYKIPRYVRFVTEFPMTVTGKARKFVMRDEMIKMLGLGETETA